MMLIPSPPIFQPTVVMRALTVAQSQLVTRIFASLVFTCSLPLRSRLKVLFHSSVVRAGETENSARKTSRNIIIPQSWGFGCRGFCFKFFGLGFVWYYKPSR